MLFRSGVISSSETEDLDWINNWKKYFSSFTIGDILIKPTWEEVNGKIREVGNDYVVPSAIQQKAVKRYEERMAQLLKDGNWYRMA